MKKLARLLLDALDRCPPETDFVRVHLAALGDPERGLRSRIR